MKPNPGSAHKRIWLIDASIYFFRYYCSLGDFYYSVQGHPTTAAYGFCQWLLKFLSAEKPDAAAVCFDESLETCFRNEIYPEYKSSRPPPDENIRFQLDACQQFSRLCGLEIFASPNFEADDLIAAIAKKAREKKFAVTVVSRDKDLAQVVLQEFDCLWDYPDGQRFYKSVFEEKNNIRTNQIASLLALTGDKVDDIPGVPGIGPKTASQLLKHYDDWAAIRCSMPEISSLPIRGAKKLAEKLDSYKDQIDMAFKLTCLADEAHLDSSAVDKRKDWLKPVKPDWQQLEEFIYTLGIQRNIQKALIKWRES